MSLSFWRFFVKQSCSQDAKILYNTSFYVRGTKSLIIFLTFCQKHPNNDHVGEGVFSLCVHMLSCRFLLLGLDRVLILTRTYVRLDANFVIGALLTGMYHNWTASHTQYDWTHENHKYFTVGFITVALNIFIMEWFFLYNFIWTCSHFSFFPLASFNHSKISKCSFWKCLAQNHY